MKIDSKITKTYLQTISKRCHKAAVITAAQNLIAELSEHQTINPAEIKFCAARKKDLTSLAQILQVGYNTRYSQVDQEELASFNETGFQDNIQTFLAKHRDQNGHEIILATIRLVADKIELTQLFTPVDGQLWPFQAKKLPLYEYERLAFHPLFDLLPDRQLQAFIIKNLFSLTKKSIKDKKYWLVGIISPNVKKFLDVIGIKVQEIPNLTLADNELTAFLKANWPRYWQNAKPYEFI